MSELTWKGMPLSECKEPELREIIAFFERANTQAVGYEVGVLRAERDRLKTENERLWIALGSRMRHERV